MADKRDEAAGGDPRPESGQRGNAPLQVVTIDSSPEDLGLNDSMVVSPERDAGGSDAQAKTGGAGEAGGSGNSQAAEESGRRQIVLRSHTKLAGDKSSGGVAAVSGSWDQTLGVTDAEQVNLEMQNSSGVRGGGGARKGSGCAEPTFYCNVSTM